MGPYKSGAPVTQTRIVFPFYIILPLAAPAFMRVGQPFHYMYHLYEHVPCESITFTCGNIPSQNVAYSLVNTLFRFHFFVAHLSIPHIIII